LRGEGARLVRVPHRRANAFRLHKFLFQKRAQQDSADLSRSEDRNPLARKAAGPFSRTCRFHDACIVDDDKPSVNILPSRSSFAF
jgi:hypothetical protein